MGTMIVTRRLCLCFTPLNLASVSSSSVSGAGSWSGEKAFKPPCCCAAFINYTPELQLYIRTSAVHLCQRLSVCADQAKHLTWHSTAHVRGVCVFSSHFTVWETPNPSLCLPEKLIEVCLQTKYRERKKERKVCHVYFCCLCPVICPILFNLFVPSFVVFLILFLHPSIIPHPPILLSQGSLFQKSTEPKERSDLGFTCKLMFYVLPSSVFFPSSSSPVFLRSSTDLCVIFLIFFLRASSFHITMSYLIRVLFMISSLDVFSFVVLIRQ